MLLVMVYISLAAAVVAVALTAVMSAFRTTGGLDASRKALEAAEYGEIQAVANLGEGKSADLGLAEWRKLREQAASTPAGRRRLPALGEPGVAPLVLASAPGVEYVAMADVSAKPGVVLVYALGRCGNVDRRVEAVYRPADAGDGTQPTRFTRIAWRELPPAR
jgi:hypothetical protein